MSETLHLRYDPEVSQRLTAAAHRQNIAYNRTIRELWDHPATPLQTSKAEGEVGLYTNLLAWRADTPELKVETTPSALARGGIAQAKAAMTAFDESLARDTKRIIKTVEAAEKSNAKRRKLIQTNPEKARQQTAEKFAKQAIPRKPLKPWHDKKLLYERQGKIIDGIEQPVWTHGAIPKSIQKRTITLEHLLRDQADIDRNGRNIIRINEKPQRIDAHTLKVPGVGPVRTRETIPEDWDLRSVNIVEITHRRPEAHRAKPEERTWEVHVQHRIPAPLHITEEILLAEATTLDSVGCDAGVVHPLTTSSTKTGVQHHHPGRPREATSTGQSPEDLVKESQRRRRRCQPGSRTYKRLLRQENTIRQRAIRCRNHGQRELANAIAKSHDIVALEDLRLGNMTRSAQGTSDSPGANVAAKRGLNRSLAEVAPGRQAAETQAACIRHGRIYQRVNPAGTSITCTQCAKRDKKSRRSQSEFVCTGCGYAANADGNGAENSRVRGVTSLRESAKRRIERREEKRAESTARSAKPGPGNGGAAASNTAAAPYANGTGRCLETRGRGSPD